GKVTGTFWDGTAAVITNLFGQGTSVYVATCPALSYAKDAGFVADELKEKWPIIKRRFINAVARNCGAPRVVELSEPVVEAGVFESSSGAALVLANFTYKRIPRLEMGFPAPRSPKRVRSLERGNLK